MQTPKFSRLFVIFLSGLWPKRRCRKKWVQNLLKTSSVCCASVCVCVQSAAMKANLPLFLSHLFKCKWMVFFFIIIIIIIIQATSGIYPSIFVFGPTIIENNLKLRFWQKVYMLKMIQTAIDHGITICIEYVCSIPNGIEMKYIWRRWKKIWRRQRWHTLAPSLKLDSCLPCLWKCCSMSPVYCFKWRQTYVGMLWKYFVFIDVTMWTRRETNC